MSFAAVPRELSNLRAADWLRPPSEFRYRYTRSDVGTEGAGIAALGAICAAGAATIFEAPAVAVVILIIT